MADNEQGQVFQSLKGAYGVVFVLFKLGEFTPFPTGEKELFETSQAPLPYALLDLLHLC